MARCEGLNYSSCCKCGANGSDDADDDDSTGNSGPAVEIDVTRGGIVTPEMLCVAVTTRSVEEILYYLGEWARAELKLGGAANVPPLVRTKNDEQDALFVIGRQCDTALPSVQTSYFGGNYCMQINLSGQDRSAEVLAIVSQLFALNNSAQNLPSPNVISILSP